jgi:hypothetical protein
MEYEILGPEPKADDDLDEFDWLATLAAAGVPSTVRDLSQMETADMIALLVAEEKAGIDLARSVGLPGEWDALDRPILVDLSDQDQANLIETVNRVVLTKDQMAAQMQIVDLVPEAMKVGGQILARSSLERAEQLGLSDPDAPLALLARTVALQRWREEHDPHAKLDNALVIEAAARARVIMSGGMPAFDGAALLELIDFIAALPW